MRKNPSVFSIAFIMAFTPAIGWASASESVETKIDITWMMMAAALVMFMQAGFLLLEAGMVRSKNSVNVAQKNLLDFVFSVAAFAVVGFMVAFGASEFLMPGFDWNYLGTWGSLYDKLDKDSDNNAVVNAKTLTMDASGNMIRTKGSKVVVVDGLQDYIIVDKDEVLLIFPKTKEQDIKKVLQKVKAEFGEHYG